jgi:ABC-2 type transport system permease protein
MLETARYETGRRLRGTAILTVALSLYTGFIVWYFSALGDVDYEEIFADLPPAMVEAFGIQALGTIEGFLGVQIYNFLWLLGLGLYFAYTAGGLLATDIENERLDLLLAMPLSRTRLLAEKFLALLVPLVVVNVVVGAVVYGVVTAIGESVDPIHLALAHLLSVPYLLVCAGIGLAFSVAVDRAAIAERGAVGVVFVLYLVESVVGGGTDVEAVQYLSPTHYYDPTPVVLAGTYDPLDAGVLLLAVVLLLGLSGVLFRRRDL